MKSGIRCCDSQESARQRTNNILYGENHRAISSQEFVLAILLKNKKRMRRETSEDTPRMHSNGGC